MGIVAYAKKMGIIYVVFVIKLNNKTSCENVETNHIFTFGVTHSGIAVRGLSFALKD